VISRDKQTQHVKPRFSTTRYRAAYAAQNQQYAHNLHFTRSLSGAHAIFKHIHPFIMRGSVVSL